MNDADKPKKSSCAWCGKPIAPEPGTTHKGKVYHEGCSKRRVAAERLDEVWPKHGPSKKAPT